MLRQGRPEEADAQFGAAIRLDANVSVRLKKLERQKFLSEMEEKGVGRNATHLWVQPVGLERRRS